MCACCALILVCYSPAACLPTLPSCDYAVDVIVMPVWWVVVVVTLCCVFVVASLASCALTHSLLPCCCLLLPAHLGQQPALTMPDDGERNLEKEVW